MTRLAGQTSPKAHQHDPQRTRALSIFRYLRELARLKTSTVRDLNSYERVFWLNTLHDKKGCSSRCFRPEAGDTLTLDGSGEEDADEWVTVRKFAEPSLPRPPTLIQRWLVPGSDKDPDSPPKLLDRVPRESARVATSTLPNSAPKAIETPGGAADAAIPADPDAAFDLLGDFPQVVEALNTYVEREWKPWAAKHRVWRDFQQNVYAPLFGVHRDLQRLGEEFEFVLGLGCLTWKTSSGHVVRRHLVTAQATVEFDPVDGVFTLRPGADGAKLALEIDMLEPSEQPTIAQLDVIRSDLAKGEDDPWDFEVMDRVLGGFAGALDEDSKYDPHDYSVGSVDHLPRVTFAPALLLRRRNSRGLLQAFETVIEQLSKGAEIPPGVKRLTAAATDDSASDESPSSLKAGEFAPPERVYFPLPANEDQRQIVERLNSRYGVLVQGPPGTGKSHTIANLICHLLATGQRVLITAQTPRALQVLRGKLPPTVRPLCLSVLGNDKAAQDNVEHSVRNITDKADGWNEAAVRTEIGKTERELDRLLERETALERDVRVFREVEVHEHTVADGTYKGTAQAIAAHLRRDQARFNWFVDDVPVDGKPPGSSEELRAYWEGMTNIPPQRLAETEMLRPARGKDIPPGNKLLDLVRDLKSLKERVQPVADGEIQLGTLPLADLRPAHTSLQTLRTAVQQIPSAATPWAAAALTDVLREASGTWELLLADTRKGLSSLGERAAALDKGDIRLPANRRSDVLPGPARINR